MHVLVFTLPTIDTIEVLYFKKWQFFAPEIQGFAICKTSVNFFAKTEAKKRSKHFLKQNESTETEIVCFSRKCFALSDYKPKQYQYGFMVFRYF